MIGEYKRRIAELVRKELGVEEEPVIEYPPSARMGDLAVACFPYARHLRRAPQAIASELAAKLAGDRLRGTGFSEARAEGGYLNFFLDRKSFSPAVVSAVLRQGRDYGRHAPRGERIVLDYSSPNIAKPFHIGHLRSTIIGHSLKKMLAHLGYEPIGVNHLGDWGTQFGKVICAFRRWGDPAALEGDDPIGHLVELYVRFHKEAEKDPALEEEARETFRRLEQGAEEERNLWERFRRVSLARYARVYEAFGVDFDHYTGESFYEPMLDDVIGRLQEAGLARESEGALIVDLEPYGMPPCLIRKSDGATLYATRDIAAALYRMETFSPSKLVYVMGLPQELHCRQFFKVLELLDPERFRDRLVFVGFGHYRFKDRKLSTRKGDVITLEEVLEEGTGTVLEKMRETGRTAEFEDPEAAARRIAVAGIVFADLSNDRTKDVIFDWKRVLDFNGDTGPYVQYAHARAWSILRKAGLPPEEDLAAGGEGPDLHPRSAECLIEDEEFELVKKLAVFPEAVERSVREWKPHHLAQHVLATAKAFSRFYHEKPVLQAEEPAREARLLLTMAVKEVLALGLDLLCMEAPDRM